MTSFIESKINTITSSFNVKGISKNEDYVSNYSNSICSAYAVFDGHGGKYVSRDLANGVDNIPSFCEYICTKFMDYDNTILIKNYIKKLFFDYDVLLKKYHSGVIGSTATVCLTYQNNIYIAYVGDSKAMIIKDNNLVYQTLNHNCLENQVELERLEKSNVLMSDTSNFRVKNDDEIQLTTSKYHNFTFHYLKDQVSVSRVFGHFSIKAYQQDAETKSFSSQSPLIVEPTVFSLPVEEGLEVIMASDGLWDMIIDSDEIKRILTSAKDSHPENISVAFTEFAENRWKKEWSILSDKPTFKIKMTDPIQWDDISCYYLKF